MDSMEKLVSLSKRRGFVFPSSEIYGGLNGCWDYGPLGVALKRNVKQAWWEDMIARHDETETDAGSPTTYAMVGLDSALLMNPRVWEASGHVSGFSDPMVDCRETRNRYRADQLVVFALVFETTEGVRETMADMLFASPGEFGKTPLEELLAPHRKRVKEIRKARPADEALSINVIANALEHDDARARTLAPGATAPGSLTPPERSISCSRPT